MRFPGLSHAVFCLSLVASGNAFAESSLVNYAGKYRITECTVQGQLQTPCVVTNIAIIYSPETKLASVGLKFERGLTFYPLELSRNGEFSYRGRANETPAFLENSDGSISVKWNLPPMTEFKMLDRKPYSDNL